MSLYKNAPTHGGSRGAHQNTLNSHFNTDPLNLLLSRLENVKQAGDGWRACCPAHDSKSRSTLSIKLGDEGRVLLHDHAGCSALDVVHALGLELSDLFERPVTANMSVPQLRKHNQKLSEKVKMWRWKAARPEILVECNILLMAAGMACRLEPINQEDMDRTVLAGKRIRSALGDL